MTEANYAAVEPVEAIVERRIAADRSVGVGTVLSSSKYMWHVEEARRRGFFIGIRHRWTGSHDNLGRYAAKVDLLLVYSNADPAGRPVLVARKTDVGMDLLRPAISPEVDRRLSGLKPAAR